MARSELENVKAYEDTITLPTYGIRGENRNPVFHSMYGVAHIYPYTMLDDIAPTPQDRTYPTLNLENRYLRVTVLPDLGGRIYSVYDKISKREVFYKNSVIKFVPLAIRGAFFSGGVEFSFPVAHAPTTADPVNWDLRENEDGSATIFFGGLEHISRMRWTISITLYPERCAIAQDVLLQNPSPLPGRYHYWTNASLPADDETEFIYPFRGCRSYEFAGTASWPNARIDLITEDPGLEGMEGVPKWPAKRLHAPIEFRRQRNMIASVSIFGREVKWDFFGAYQHSSDYGYAHFADHRDVAGMKLWSWGNAEVGIMNQAALTDDGSLYAETQCGAMETQLDFDFLPPGKIRRWREWWLPLRGIGELTCASPETGARISLARGTRAGEMQLGVGICPVRSLDGITVRLSVPGKTLLEEKVDVSPERPWLHTEAVEAKEIADHPLTLSVVDNGGNVLLEYLHDREVSPLEPFQPRGERELNTAEDYYQAGLKEENFDNREEAMKAYEEALSLNPSHGPAHLRLGIMLLRAADFEGAAHHLGEAASLRQGEANYHLGTLHLYEGRPDEAERRFRAVPKGTKVSVAALCGLGSVALSRGRWEEATESFREALSEDSASITASVLLGIALRKAEREEDARRDLEKVLRNDPLNHVALREMAFLTGAEEGPVYSSKLERLLADDHQYILDFACFYLHAGLLDDALSILEEGAKDWEYPMVYYLIGELHQRSGREETSEWFERGASADPELVFPSRLEEVRVLERVIEENSEDYKAKYYLGNFLYAHERYEEAISLWEEAARHLSSFDIIHRNLGLAYWQRRGDLEGAISMFERALEINPENQDLYLDLDALYVARGLMDKRHSLLEKMRRVKDPKDSFRKRIVSMLVDLGRHEEAIEMLLREDFVPSEMDQSFRLVYVGAYLGRAKDYLEAGRLEEGIADYKRALEYPPNVGSGRPASPSDAEILYLLGCACEKAGRFEEAILAWQEAAREYHPHDTDLFRFVQQSIDKLNRYSEIGLC